MHKQFFLVLHLTLFSLCSAKDDFTIKEIISAPFPTSLTVSSNGDKVAWVYNESGVRNIWVASGSKFEGSPITKNTKDTGEAISSLIFTPNGDRLIFIKGSSVCRNNHTLIAIYFNNNIL